jgi:hypothetical protein
VLRQAKAFGWGSFGRICGEAILYVGIKSLMPCSIDEVTIVGRIQLDKCVHSKATRELSLTKHVENGERRVYRTLDTVDRQSDTSSDPYSDIKVSKPINLFCNV